MAIVINKYFLLSENYFLSKKKMPPRLSHQVCRSKVCAVCFGPGKVAVTPLLADHIQRFAHKTQACSHGV